MASTDELSALKRNVVHQTRLTLELQQLDKKRSVRLREMDKSSHVFMRRLEQMKEVRKKANLPSVRRTESTPLYGSILTMHKEKAGDESAQDFNLPFITKSLTLEPASQRRLSRSKSSPAVRARRHSPPQAHAMNVPLPSNRNTETPRSTNKDVGLFSHHETRPRCQLVRRPNHTQSGRREENSSDRIQGKGIMLNRRKSESSLLERY